MAVRHRIMNGMQLIRSGSMNKSFTFSSIIKNASFSSGWLHFAVQCFFAVITVTSFILIVMMAIPKHSPNPQGESKCYSTNCIVYCDGVPYFDEFKQDIYITVMQLPSTCTGFYLMLRNGMFVNQTLLTSSFPRMRLPINELAIIGGNLNHLPSEAFLNQYAATIRTVLFVGLTIKSWTSDCLAGLSSLSHVYIKKCTIESIEPDAFRPVHDTLDSLTITQSGKWDPANITGTTKLTQLSVVDFSNNVFHDVLNKNSFTGLGRCKILYLNSCKITAIGAGTFDHLYKIETLFLNNNYLVTIPFTLFSNIISITDYKPRINLQDNPWRCGCEEVHLRQLITKDMLLTDPICNSPKYYKGRSFFSLDSFCSANNLSYQSPPTLAKEWSKLSGVIYVNNGCYSGNENSSVDILKVMTPVPDHQCTVNLLNKSNFKKISLGSRSGQVIPNNWIKFSLFLTSGSHSIVQINTVGAKKYGILWYQSTCPNEVYCVNMVPDNLRVYNANISVDYIFCPVQLNSGGVELDKCVNYNLGEVQQTDIGKKISILLYISTGIVCLVLGAICVYALVRMNPNLLKGSKRILFVKHKTVDALVLPPKVPMRNDLTKEDTFDDNEDKIFVVPMNSFDTVQFNRSKSERSSSKSNAPSYISALQPTEDQLAEWRIRNHSTNDPTSQLSYLWIRNTDSSYYMDVIDNDKTYESLK